MKDPWVSYSDRESVLCVQGSVIAYFELLVTPQDLRAQRKVVHRAVVIVVNGTAFPVLPLVGRLCP